MTPDDRIQELSGTVNPELDDCARRMIEQGYELHEAVREFRHAMVRQAVIRMNGHQINAANLLGIHRNVIYWNLERIAFQPKENVR